MRSQHTLSRQDIDILSVKLDICGFSNNNPLVGMIGTTNLVRINFDVILVSEFMSNPTSKTDL